MTLPAAAPQPPAQAARPRARWLLLGLGGLLAALLLGLGSWQLQRLRWKLDLIERVEQRVHAPAVPAPGAAQWPAIDARSDEYRHVRASGTWLDDKTRLVQAATVLGAGFWVLTPLRDAQGQLIYVNRGFVPQRAAVAPAGPAPADVQGLLRLNEAGGGFLRHNDAPADRWYSRDVLVMAQDQGLAPAAPYFIDADAPRADLGQSGAAEPSPALPQVPVPGLTVLKFSNNHLVYALTWYALALMVLAALVYVLRQDRTNAA